MSFNHYYQSELTALRQLGRRFAERAREAGILFLAKPITAASLRQMAQLVGA